MLAGYDVFWLKCGGKLKIVLSGLWCEIFFHCVTPLQRRIWGFAGIILN